MILSITKNKIIGFLLLLVIISIATNIFLYFKDEPVEDTQERDFAFVEPSLAEMDQEYFRNNKKYYQTNFLPLRELLNQTIQSQKKAVHGIYFESLNTGSWIGINEKKGFVPASLLKIAIVTAALKKIEEEELTPDTLITVQPKDINTLYGAIGLIKAGDQYTVLELINYTFYYSDNTAANALMQVLTKDEFQETAFRIGISYRATKNLTKSGDLLVSPRDFSNIFRSLYYSNYLKRKNSNLVLSYLTQTAFRQGLPAGVPPEIIVSHKVGYRLDPQYGEEHHDCGIIYYPKVPYMLCIMTIGFTQQEADSAIEDLSKITYDYMRKQTS